MIGARFGLAARPEQRQQRARMAPRRIVGARVQGHRRRATVDRGACLDRRTLYKIDAVDDLALEPWMLRADWRDDRRPLLTVDLATWPADLPLAPLPPVPVIAIGAATHPQTARADVRLEPPLTLSGLVRRIAETPQAAATLVQLLRAIEGLPRERALPLASFAFAMLQGSSEHAAWRARHDRGPLSPPGMLHITRAGDLLDLRIDRPQVLNAIDRTMRDALSDAYTLAALDPDIARVRLRSTGRCFSVGADLAEFGTTRDPAKAHAIRSRTMSAHALIRRPTANHTHVQGCCVGAGLELAAFAARLTASGDAWFQLPEVAMGIIPGFGGCFSVPARVGRQRAAALMLSGKRVGAATALEWGLIDAIVDEPAADDRRADEPG